MREAGVEGGDGGETLSVGGGRNVSLNHAVEGVEDDKGD